MNILGGGVNILGMANSLLDNGRAIFQRNGGTGLSARSRAQAEDFMNGGTALFNQLYARTENAELSNKVKILALRGQNKSLVAGGMFDTAATNLDTGATAASDTTGTNLDTQA